MRTYGTARYTADRYTGEVYTQQAEIAKVIEQGGFRYSRSGEVYRIYKLSIFNWLAHSIYEALSSISGGD